MDNPFNFILDELLALRQEVLKLQLNAQSPAPAREIIDRSELRKRLGITDPTIIQYVKKGIIPEIRIGGSIRYDYGHVLESLTERKKAKHGTALAK